MTVGKMIELLGSKAAVGDGRLRYGTAFGEGAGLADDVASISASLVRCAARRLPDQARLHSVHPQSQRQFS
jgi:hypothetical protein